ncbi:hypothetical protein KQH42_23285 [Streptomyces sp. CHA1]|uniref:lipoprotein n=1 Tax=Streptomyces TaxID=1883 RepID=UPI00053EBB67|nr:MULTISPECIES: lipoprotein [unclassified Streptomyces]QPA01700.1 hypothetical protein DI273_24620 [Streptomyces violascens]WSB19904.1 hypothetical protein OHB02_06600 [Streptomyces albidoflavus]MBT3155812.1 hypothetical protein [Streptomyces sp. G11C]MCO6703330.1 hypothetical protein [Streptomyces sp. CHB9.2]MCO6709691.1 hypothetical protein [Streptomyces sp. CHA3]
MTEAQGVLGRRRAARLGLAALLAAGCAPTSGPAPLDRERATALLDRRATALRERDPAAWSATSATSTGQDGLWARLAEVPLAGWAYRVTGVRADSATATVEATLRYRLRGEDPAPATARRLLGLVRHEGRWRVRSEEAAPGAAQLLWDQGRVRARRGSWGLVLGTGSAGQVREFARLAERAVPVADDAWGGDWPRRVVVLVPGSLAGTAALLGGEPDAYRGVAAVTTGTPEPGTPADRIVVNPEAYRELDSRGKQFVLTHETVHVATRSVTGPATPLWLSEGFADRAAHRAAPRPLPAAAPALAAAVARGEVPRALPDDAAFAFDGDGGALDRAYEGGWLACRLLADRWGEERLRAFYRAAGTRAGEAAFREVLGTTRAQFTAAWRAYLRERLG